MTSPRTAQAAGSSHSTRMHRIRGLAGTALVLPALLTLSGCAAVRVCAEAESGPPRPPGPASTPSRIDQPPSAPG